MLAVDPPARYVRAGASNKRYLQIVLGPDRVFHGLHIGG
jgi:hypothetical protein